MQSILYIYDKTWTSIIAQVFDSINLSIILKLSDIWSAEFDIPVVKKDWSIHEALQDISILKKKNRIKIWFFRDGIETIVFDGIIANITDSALATHVICEDRLHILKEDRKIIEDLSYTSKSISFIVSDIFSRINTTEDTWLTVSCVISDVQLQKDYSAGQSVFDILQDLSEGWYQFGISWDIVYLDSFIWVDRSIGTDRVELLYEYNQARSRSIEDFSFSSDVRNIKNAIYAKNTWGTIISSTDSASITEYYRKEDFISVNWDVASETSKYLTEHKDDTIEISIIPTSRDFSLANVGDKVWVHIDRGDVRCQYDGTMIVQSKEFIDSDLPEVKYWFSTSKIRTPTILEKIKTMADDIKILKNI